MSLGRPHVYGLNCIGKFILKYLLCQPRTNFHSCANKRKLVRGQILH